MDDVCGKRPFFSIIMPVWNGEEYIVRAIESVIAQSFTDYELLIIDDGSIDSSPQIIEPYRSERIIYIKQPHAGVSLARNRGLCAARGRFIAYLDTDNAWRPDFLERMYHVFQRTPVPQSAYCKWQVHRKDPLTKKICAHHIGGVPFNFSALEKENTIDLNAFVHAAHCCETAGMFDQDLKRLNDWDFITRITRYFPPYFVREILVDYYDRISYNTITAREAFKPPYRNIRRKIMSQQRSAFLYHDAIKYTWKGISEVKYRNWKAMYHPVMNINDFTSPGYPCFLEIEPTNTCNLSCTFCPVANKQLNRPPRHMTLDEYAGLIDDMEPYLLFAVLWDWGEPFMNPQLPDMIRYATDRDIRTVTSTNAHFLKNTEFAAEVLKAGLSTIIVAIDSLDEETYQLFRRKGSLSQVLEGLNDVIRLKKQLHVDTLINMRMVITKNNEHELKRLRQVARSLGIRFTVKTVNPSVTSDATHDDVIIPVNPDYRRYAYKKGTYDRIRHIDKRCGKVWRTSSIHSNGCVVPCCYDYSAQSKMGNILEKPFTEIWNDAPYRELRRTLYAAPQSIPKCYDCDINFQYSPAGWFVEQGVRKNLVKKLKNYVHRSALRKYFSERTSLS